jgi:hypothetical protein
VYDADGNKLQKIFTPEGSSITTVTSYINGFVYKGDDLQYINFEEGRIRVMQAINQSNGYDHLQIDGNIDLPGSKRGAYDYFIRDYQGNVRMILTEETHVGGSSCTMEPAMEDSRVIYGKFGRQTYRVDFSDHMRPLEHSNPHLHEYEYSNAFKNGKETLYNFG